MVNLNELEDVIDTIRIIVIIVYTFYVAFKVINQKISKKKMILLCILTIPLVAICKIIKDMYGYGYCIIYMIFLISLIISKLNKNNMSNSILISIMSLSINYIIYFISIAISFIPNVILHINNDLISLVIIIIIYTILIYLL